MNVREFIRTATESVSPKGWTPDSRVSAFATAVCYEVGIIKKECFDAKTFELLGLDNVLKRHVELQMNKCFKIIDILGKKSQKCNKNSKNINFNKT